VACGLVPRLILARETFLNPDEALHYLLSDQPSLRLAYEASLTTAHPPLLILVLYSWRLLGHSEFTLRTPALLTGTAFCWIMFVWLKKVTDRTTALIGLTLLLFIPSLITLSAEVRQYSLLLFFSSASLYFLECALEKSSPWMMLRSAFALYFALLSHYSSLIFALAIGIYALVRLLTRKGKTRLIAVWVAGQCGALALCAFFVKSHVFVLRKKGLPQDIAETWLRASLFHHGEDHLASFILTRTTRLFRYLFSQGTIGVIALLLFILAIAFLLRDKGQARGFRKPTPRHLALLLVLPFLIALGASFAGFYPYGGTRHDSILSGFAITGASIGLARLNLPWDWKWLKPLALAVGLTICHLFTFPVPPFIPRKNQNRKFMSAAIQFIRQTVPPGSVLYVDEPGGLVLGYYLCGNSVVPFENQSQPFMTSRCGPYQTVAPSRRLRSFDPDTFRGTAEEMQRRHQLNLAPQVWMFQSGWIDWQEDLWIAQLRPYGCYDPHRFGPNILVCQMMLEAADASSAGVKSTTPIGGLCPVERGSENTPTSIAAVRS
jgi:hypothetical protein